MREGLHVLLRTYSSNPESSGGCDYALLKLSRPYVHQLKLRMRMAAKLIKRDDAFFCLEYLDWTPLYFSWWEGLESLVDVNSISHGEPAFIKEARIQKIPEHQFAQVELPRMVVSPDEVCWECRPKYSDYTVIETAGVREQLFPKYGREGR